MTGTLKKHIIFTFSAILLFCTFNASAKNTTDGAYLRYNHPSFNVTLLLPVGWARQDIDLSYSTIIVLTKHNHSEIKITFSGIDRDEEIKWKNWQDWYTEGIGSGLKLIVDQDNISITREITGRLLVFEYRSKNRKTLQRIMIARYNGKQVTIECSSPLDTFYKHNETFDTLMKSIEVIDKSSVK